MICRIIYIFQNPQAKRTSKFNEKLEEKIETAIRKWKIKKVPPDAEARPCFMERP